ncbi:MAG: putative Phenylalanine--tRNA ligase alpha subunit [Streblomastix strix]|uniref:phenylalanine--tRNA ligase n=1 Tax=Streblomastix strix TaxID=222440 RepID=A0A5J4W784_9EUKA|nr:MAG: putative Phenylalanine--tRNA ligase alpha subunit [Streblomastix strix]
MAKKEAPSDLIGKFRIALLETLKKNESIENVLDLLPEVRQQWKELEPALKSFVSKDYVESQVRNFAQYSLTDEGSLLDLIISGKITVDQNSKPQIVEGEQTRDLTQDELNTYTKEIQNNVIEVTGTPHTIKFTRNYDKKVRNTLKLFNEQLRDKIVNKNDIKAALKTISQTKMDLTKEADLTQISVKRGKQFIQFTAVDPVSLTNDMLRSGEWNSVPLKQKNFTIPSELPLQGKLHPLVEMRSQFRRILLNLGFTEMFTRRYVESSFWNFDTLFQPQAHPCRDQHDTFFVAHGGDIQEQIQDGIPESFQGFALANNMASSELINRVRSAHEQGGEVAGGSIGLRYKWNPLEAQKLIMRTHTTAISTHTLATLNSGLQRIWNEQGNGDEWTHQEGGIQIKEQQQKNEHKWERGRLAKFFSIDRVFRNETLDRTHLAEFHQLEGFVVGEGLHVGHLMGIIAEFFAQIGLTEIRFQPTYNPYTEPSLEIYAVHPVLQKEIEIGNSGVFREEVMIPLGLPKGVRAIAWGLSLERPAMIQTRLQEISELIGHRVDMRWVESSALKLLHK